MLGDSSTEMVYIPLMSKLPVMPKRRYQILSLGGLEVHKTFCRRFVRMYTHTMVATLGGGGTRYVPICVVCTHNCKPRFT